MRRAFFGAPRALMILGLAAVPIGLGFLQIETRFGLQVPHVLYLGIDVAIIVAIVTSIVWALCHGCPRCGDE